MADPSVGTLSKPAIISAVVFVVVVLAGILLALPKLFDLFEREKVELVNGSVSERLEPTEGEKCLWTVSFAVFSPNRPPGHIWVVDVDVSVDQRVRPLSPTGAGRVWERLDMSVAYEFTTCPAEVSDIDHGDLEVTYRRKNQRGLHEVKLGF